MLVLTRRVGESVLIGDDIEITVLDVKGENVRVGVRAPRETRIQRSEIVDAVREENISAAESSDEAAQAALLDALSHRRR